MDNYDFVLYNVSSFLTIREIASLACVSHLYLRNINSLLPLKKEYVGKNSIRVFIPHHIGETDVLLPIIASSLNEFENKLHTSKDELLLMTSPIYIVPELDKNPVILSYGYKPIQQKSGIIDVCNDWGKWSHAHIIRIENEHYLLQYWGNSNIHKIHYLSPRLSSVFHTNHMDFFYQD